MEVLKEGSPHGWSAEYECTGKGNGDGGCGALLLVTEDDLYYTQQEDYGGGFSSYVMFTCISCKVKTDVVSDGNSCLHEVPYRVQQKARNNKKR